MLKKRIASSILLAALTSWLIFFAPDMIFAVAIIAIIGTGLYEFFTLVEKKGIFIYKYVGIVLGLLVPLAIYNEFELTKGWELTFIVTACLFLFVLQFTRKDSSQAIVGISTTFFGIVYVSWFFSFIIKLKFLDHGVLMVAFLILVTKMGDIGAYLVGTRFGRHYLIPRISPKKSIEGAVGGFVFSLVSSSIGGMFLPIPFPHLLTLGCLLGILGQLGDLSESLIKRDCQVKDSGNLVPGLGGMLDLIDSLLFTAPVLYFYILYFAPKF